MKTKRKDYFIICMTLIAAVLMTGQILEGIRWMCRNITAMPSFGDSTEYINLSQTLVLDEYRPILYPFLLRLLLTVIPQRIPFQIILYGIQTVVSFASIFYGIIVIDRVVLKTHLVSARRRVVQLFLTLYLMTIPMLTFMNFTILTDSLATSMLIILITSLIRMIGDETAKVGNYLLMGCSLAAESLLRADRLYSSLVLVAIVFLIKAIRDPKTRKRVAISGVCVCLCTGIFVKGVGRFTQTPGVYGRVKTNLEFVLLDRIVWPNMYANYWNFPQEIRYIITIEEAETFDQHNNNVMYQLAPLVISRVGEDKAREVFLTMAGVVFDKNTKKVLNDIGEDIAAMFFTPVSSFLNARGRCDKADSWNIHCMSTVTPDLTNGYNTFYQVSFLILIGIGCILSCYAVLRHKKRNLKCYLKVLLPYLGMSVILTLWFSLGDGAPPNDRYALLIYFFWSLVSVGLLGFWTGQTSETEPSDPI